VRLRNNAGVELVEKLDSDAREVSRVRHAVATALSSAGVSDDETDVVALLVSELVTNAIRHGRPPLTIRAEHSDGSVTVGVEDASSTVPVPVEDTSWDASGGRGLHLVEALADGWGVIRNGNGKRVWFRLELSSAG
jgi:anti-sigma regulatory factor (Ser/Thr protein kinase)